MIGRLLYGALFVLLLPLLLAAWAARLTALTALPAIHHVGGGAAVATAGVALILWSMALLWRRGGGLPMNAFPPPRLVAAGPYAWVRHPIYVGFVLAVAGVALAVGSPGGLWIVAPATAAGCVALVLGYEGASLRRRFGTLPETFFSLPPPTEAPARWSDGLAVVVVLFLPWLVLYELLGHLPVPGARESSLSFERTWPVLTWSTPIYSSAYLAALAPFAARRRRELRRFADAALVGMTLGFLAYLVVPLVAPPRDFDGAARFAALLALERADGLEGRAAFPAFHLFWALMAAWMIATRWPTAAIVGWLWAALIALSCLSTGMHSVADLVAAGVLFALATAWPRIADAARAGAERVANSWREWRVGPLRIINHGAYAGAAAALGAGIIDLLTGGQESVAVVVVAASSLLGAALWGQYWVGSRTLLRPFGYFGSVLGIGLALAALGALGSLPVDGWTLAAACAVAAPWVQAVGRLRCLVQGCCHGAPTDPQRGIRYRHPRSRVVVISKLASVPVHATPLHSIVCNAIIGMLIARLWAVEADGPMIVGAYLFLAGLSRFVEESLRGEVQTPIVRGLRLYQWFAVGSVLVGAAITCLAAPLRPPGARFDAQTVVVCALVGLLHWVAMGVDLPEGRRRLSRLG